MLSVLQSTLIHAAAHVLFAALFRLCHSSVQWGAAQQSLRNLRRDLPQPLELVHIVCHPAAAPSKDLNSFLVTDIR